MTYVEADDEGAVNVACDRPDVATAGEDDGALRVCAECADLLDDEGETVTMDVTP